MRARALLLPLVAAAALLAGCQTASPGTTTPQTNGVEALSASEIATKATEALNKAGSYHIKGSADQDGTKAEIDLVVNGKDLKGTVKAKDVDLGTGTKVDMTIEIIKVADGTYIKADDLWKTLLGAGIQDKTQLDAVVALIKGKYIKAPANDPSLKEFVPDAADMLKPEGGGDWTKGDVTTVAGKPVITLKDSKGNKLYVSTVGEPLPVRLESADAQTIDITDVGSAGSIAAPSASEVIDLAQIMAGMGGS